MTQLAPTRAPLTTAADDPAAPALVVGHSVGVWLEQTQTWLYNQIRYLPAAIESHIFCEATENLEQFQLPNIHALGRPGGLRGAWQRLAVRLNRPTPTPGVAAALRRCGARVLHSHFGWSGWHNCRLANDLGLKHIVTFYGLDVNYLPRHGWLPRYRELFERVDRVLCEGPHMAACIAELGCPREKIHVHHLGVAVDEIPFRPRMRAPGEPLRVLLAASFREKKGLPYALEALGQLQHEVDLQITIIGDAGRDPAAQREKQRILDTIARHRLERRTTMLGYQPYARFFEEAYRHHVYMAPSVTAENGDTEGGAPVALIEMAASGMVVIATRHCDIPNVIEDGVGGLLVDERDSLGLVRCLRELVAKPACWRSFAEHGRRCVEERFASGVLGGTLGDTYSALVEDGRT